MDQLTGLGLPEDLSASLVAAGSGGVLGVYLNIDGFNGVNYTFGHVEGDRILAEVGCWLAQEANTLGVEAFRVAGNEFLLLGAALSERDAVRVAEGIVRDSQTFGIPYAHPASDRKDFSMSAIVFRARVEVQARLEGALDQLRDAAYAAKCEAGRSFGVVGSTSTVEFPTNMESTRLTPHA